MTKTKGRAISTIMRWKQKGRSRIKTAFGIAFGCFWAIERIVGLAGIIDDLPRWKDLYNMIPQQLSWFLLGASLPLLYDHAKHKWGNKVQRWLCDGWAWITKVLCRLVAVRYMYLDETNERETPWRVVYLKTGYPKVIGPSLVWDSTHDIRLIVEVPLGYRMSFKSEDQPEQEVPHHRAWSGPSGVRYVIQLSQMPKGGYHVLANVFEWDYKMDVFDNRGDNSDLTVPR